MAIAAGGFLLCSMSRSMRRRGGHAAAVARSRAARVPGRYLARDQADGSNPGAGYIRVALVQDQETTAKRCIDWLVYWAEELHVGH